MNFGELLNSLIQSFWNVLPMAVNLFIALFLLLLGFLIAKGLGFLVTSLLKLIRLDDLAKQIHVNDILIKGEIKKTLSDLVGDLVYWVVILITVVGVAGIFGLAAEPALVKVFAFAGVVFLAALILGVGLFLASLISDLVRAVMANFGLQGAKTASRLIYYIIIIFAFFAALSELGIATDIFISKLDVIIGAFGLAAAIAFGLGCKDMAADFLHNLIKGK